MIELSDRTTKVKSKHFALTYSSVRIGRFLMYTMVPDVTILMVHETYCFNRILCYIELPIAQSFLYSCHDKQTITVIMMIILSQWLW